jgi:cytochrome P450
VHPQSTVTLLHQRYSLPDVFYVDLWPVGPVFMVLASPDAAAHAVQTRGYGKDACVEDIMGPVVGRDSIVSINGPAWKHVHRLVAPAFRPSAVRNLLGTVAEAAQVFVQRLSGMAEKGGDFELEGLVRDLVFTVIRRAVLGPGPETPTAQDIAISHDLRLPSEELGLQVKSMNPVTKWLSKRRAKSAMKRTGVFFTAEITKRYRSLKAAETKVGNSLLDAIIIDRIQAEQAGNVKPLDKDHALLELICTQYELAPLVWRRRLAD